jgi:hypothetical protein
MNQTGGRQTTDKADMAAFDRLPEDLRAALRNAPYDFGAIDIGIYARTYGGKHALVRFARSLPEISKQQVLLVWGADHPALWKPSA